MEYEVDGEYWLTMAFETLERMFPGVTRSSIGALHKLAKSRPDLAPAWQMTCGLAGIRPLVPTGGMDVAKFAPINEREVAAQLGIEMRVVVHTVSLLQMAWQQELSRADLAAFPPPTPQGRPPILPLTNPTTNGKQQSCTVSNPTPAPTKPERPERHFTPEQLERLRLANFSVAVFDYHENEFDRNVETEWLCERIEDVRKAFSEPRAKGLARSALLNELHLRRINDKLVCMDSASKEFRALQETKASLEKTYGEQWEQLEEVCPAATATASRKESLRVLSDFVAYLQRVSADPTMRPRDGILTDDEIQVMLRTSVQQPEPPYRMGWVLACNLARLGLNDPKWKRQMNKTQCKLVDTSFAYAFKKLSEHMGVSRPDLELEGPDGEYPPLHLEADGEITEPEALEGPEELTVPPVEIEEPKAA